MVCAGKGAGGGAAQGKAEGAGRQPQARLVLAPRCAGGALRCSPHRLARRNSLRSLRELRSDNRRENDGRCALRAPPVRLRFSAAHEARLRLTARAPGLALGRAAARAFADTVVVFAGNGPSLMRAPPTSRERHSAAGRARGPGRGARRGGGARASGDVGGAEQRSVGVGARSALRTSGLRRLV